MRRDDVNGARCRSDGVWMVLARDYVKRDLEKKSRSCTDLISVVLMRDEAEVVARAEPTDWVLHNKLVGQSPSKESSVPQVPARKSSKVRVLV